MIKMSVCMGTARADYAMPFYPEMHIFDYTLAALREQTFRDFEFVVCDILYDQRKDYFKDHSDFFLVKHIPIKPNIWTPNELFAISTTKNTCAMFAEGEIIVFIDDCISFSKHYLKNIYSLVSDKNCVSNLYQIYKGEKLIFSDLRSVGPSKNCYGNIALTMDNFLKLNGFDEGYDGGKGFEDTDLGYRLTRGFGLEISLLGDYAQYQHHAGSYPSLNRGAIKCAQNWLDVARDRNKKGLWAANSKILDDIEYEILTKCAREVSSDNPYCIAPKKNGKLCNWLDPITGKCKSCASDLSFLYRDSSLCFSLKEQRKAPHKVMGWEGSCQL